MADLVVSVEEHGGKGAVVARQGGVELGRMTWTSAGPSRIISDHTEVSDAARGMGVGEALFDRLVATARERAWTVTPLCPYVASRFQKRPEARDVL